MSLFSRSQVRRPRTEAGTRIYAIGDVHGRYDLLVSLRAMIGDHLARANPVPERVKIILLGDIIDRGPSSRECLNAIRREIERPDTKIETILLRGNHEHAILQATHVNPLAAEFWLRHGGLATLESFGLDPPRPGEDAIDFAERLREGVPETIWTFLDAAPLSHADGDYLFVHAGVRPNVSFQAQEDDDLLSIRDAFTGSTDWHGAMIVHGHSIVDFVELRPNRIACDTGAWRTNRLSCVCLDGELQTVLST